MNDLAGRLSAVSPATIERLHRGGRRVHLGIAVVMIPLMFAVGGWMAWRDLRPFLFWRATDAIIMQSDVARVVMSRPQTRWRPRVHYRWEFGGRWLQGDRYAVTEYVYRRRSDAFRVALRYTGGQHVTVWVNPDSPDEAVLDRTPSFFPYLFMLVVGLLTALVVFMRNPRERSWRAGGPGWKLEVRMPGQPVEPGVENRPIE